MMIKFLLTASLSVLVFSAACGGGATSTASVPTVPALVKESTASSPPKPERTATRAPSDTPTPSDAPVLATTPSMSAVIVDEVYPAETLAHFEAGVALHGEGKLEQAIAEYDGAINLGFQEAHVYYNRGLAFYNLGQDLRSIEDLDGAIRLDPELASAHATRALAFTFLGKDDVAQRDVDRAVELGFDQGRLDRAVEEARKRR